MPKILTTLALLTVFSLIGCSGMAHKPFYIEYDEEVKLHTGEIIVVHIKRKYVRDGSFEGAFAPKPKFAYAGPVEITWDTGFAGVGRKTVQMDQVVVIQKVNNKWFIRASNERSAYPQYVNRFFENYSFILLDSKGFVKLADSDFQKFFPLVKEFRPNILEPISVSVLYKYNDKVIRMDDKFLLDKTGRNHLGKFAGEK